MDYILILNFHNFNSKAIAKMLRNSNVYALIKNGNTLVGSVDIQNCKGVIMCGDYAGSVSGIEVDKAWFQTGLPILALGSCALALNSMFGGRASEDSISDESEAIQYSDEIESPLKTQTHALINGRGLLPGDRMRCFAYVRDDICIDIKHTEKEIYGIQRKFERNDPDSIELITNFVYDICHCKDEWDVEKYAHTLIEEARNKSTGRSIYCAVSGGVDSAVASYILKQAVGDELTCIFVDTGFFRENEAEEICDFYTNILRLEIRLIDAKDIFAAAIQDIEDNHQKIQLVHKKLSEILEKEMLKCGSSALLVSGANYNDRLFQNDSENEVTSENSKYEHYYPLKDLFKFEVKRLAEAFLLPDNIIHRKPFPSAGLALSIIGQATPEKLSMIRRIYEIYSAQIQDHNLEKKLWKYSVRLVPLIHLKNKYQVYLRAAPDSQNLVTYAFRMPYDLLESVSAQVMKEFSHAIRYVLYDLSPIQNLNILE